MRNCRRVGCQKAPMNLIIASQPLSQVQGYDHRWTVHRTPEAHFVATKRCPSGIFEAVVEVVVEEVDILWMRKSRILPSPHYTEMT